MVWVPVFLPLRVFGGLPVWCGVTGPTHLPASDPASLMSPLTKPFNATPTSTLAVQTSLSCVLPAPPPFYNTCQLPAWQEACLLCFLTSISPSTPTPPGRFPFFLCLSSDAENNIWHIVLSISKTVKYWIQESNLCFISVDSRQFPSGLNICWRLRWVPFSFQGTAGKDLM